ncbi:14782_t:CDS:2 [Cetraspora pellucida]|uniref:14782_t:CDS:1 n=1 Tax=Cetraspora pellucida TaxID=1433469 RepID=A0A9N8YYZ9_9GLOM|nr:14782_t:CDS:2 [Cetraspora pellucida]
MELLSQDSQCPLCPQCNQPKTLYHWCPKRRRGHGTIYTAVWTNEFGTTNVVLKRLNDTKEISAKFLQELAAYMKCSSITSARNYVIKAYGITKDRDTEEFMMVTQHAELGDLRNFCNEQSDSQDNRWWSETIIEIMYGIIKGLTIIHQEGLVHRDLHSGNILIHGQAFSFKRYSCIGDLGLCQADLLEKFKDEKKKMTHPKAVYTSRYLRYQKIGEYLDLWEFQDDTRENKNLLGPQPWVRKDLKGVDMIAIPAVMGSQNA